jgi:hypothetical protein
VGARRIAVFEHATLFPPHAGRRASIAIPLDRSQEPISIEKWIRQWVVNPSITIIALIERTANEEVAHTDDEKRQLLAGLASSGVKFVSRADLEAGRLDNGDMAQETYRMLIVGIGECVAARVRELLSIG